MCRLPSIAGALLAFGMPCTQLPHVLADGPNENVSPCLTVPSEVVAWWRAENTVFDEVGGFAVERSHEVQFAEGKLGLSWQFNGEASEIIIEPSYRLAIHGADDGISFETWIAPEPTTHRQVIVTWENPENENAFELFLDPPTIAQNLWTIGIARPDSTLTILAPIQPGSFQHLALTYHPRDGMVSFFINGALQSSGNFSIGGLYLSRVKFGGKDGSHFKGRLDETIIYSRQLTAEEILRSATSASGYCLPERAPTFITPLSYRYPATIGEPFILVGEVQGAGPITYQWRHHGTNLPGQTFHTLFKENISLADGGRYDLIATNSFGSITSRVTWAVIHLLGNGSFEAGPLRHWQVLDLHDATLPVGVSTSGRGPAAFTSSPLEGAYSLSHGFDAHSTGVIRIHQDLLELPAGTQIRFSYRARWNLEINQSIGLPREFRFVVEPAGGGAPLLSTTLLTIQPNTKNFIADWQTRAVNLNSFAGQKVRIAFEWTVPEPGDLLAMFELDAIHLFNNSGPALEASVRDPQSFEIIVPNAPNHFTLWSSPDARNWGLAQEITNVASTLTIDLNGSPPTRFFQISVP